MIHQFYPFSLLTQYLYLSISHCVCCVYLYLLYRLYLSTVSNSLLTRSLCLLTSSRCLSVCVCVYFLFDSLGLSLYYYFLLKLFNLLPISTRQDSHLSPLLSVQKLLFLPYFSLYKPVFLFTISTSLPSTSLPSPLHSQHFEGLR